MKLELRSIHFIFSKHGLAYILYKGPEIIFRNPQGHVHRSRVNMTNTRQYAEKVKLKKVG